MFNLHDKQTFKLLCYYCKIFIIVTVWFIKLYCVTQYLSIWIISRLFPVRSIYLCVNNTFKRVNNSKSIYKWLKNYQELKCSELSLILIKLVTYESAFFSSKHFLCVHFIKTSCKKVRKTGKYRNMKNDKFLKVTRLKKLYGCEMCFVNFSWKMLS